MGAVVTLNKAGSELEGMVEFGLLSVAFSSTSLCYTVIRAEMVQLLCPVVKSLLHLSLVLE